MKDIDVFDNKLKEVETRSRAKEQLRGEDLIELGNQYIFTSRAALQRLTGSTDKQRVLQLQQYFDQLQTCSEVAKLLRGPYKPAKRRRKS